jgi:hypothetical protein
VSVAWWARNAANPMSGTGTQQARNPRCGENRRGGEKPRGRNGTPWLGCHGPKAHCPSARTRSCRGGVCREWTAASKPEEGTSKDQVRGRQDHASTAGPRSRGARCAGGPVAHRARRTRSEGGEADAGSETRRHASVGTPWSRTGNGKRQEGSGEGLRAAAGR